MAVAVDEKLAKLAENEEFVEAFRKVTTPEEVVDLYAKYGFELPIEVAQEIFEPSAEEGAELTPEDLENVAGGGKLANAMGAVYGCIGYLAARGAGWSKKNSKKYAKGCAAVGKAIGKGFEAVL